MKGVILKVFVNHTCYTHLLWMLTFRAKEFATAVSKHECTQPAFEHEGMAGYVECKMIFEVKDIALFAKIFNDWYAATNRSDFYSQITKNCRC